ncbi:membrane protein [Lentilactobacillus fungorum]|uniref:Membrane protein n=1 Tax=Lentilactobacillus fungorum TaxID=2201250 RepID=A0ABQ3W0E7_9LACO|nr:ECF transporter S component [Lentilactobacillus fungorum]GHP13936.1 membrane protein [Lentilactobacillus fungorum]
MNRKNIESKIGNNIHKLVLVAMFIAVTVTISRLFIIPVPMTHGNVNLCDAGIFISALLLGSKFGAIIGGFSGFLLDLVSGYGQYMWFSLIIHGLEGLIVGLIAGRESNRKIIEFISLIAGILMMVMGYFFADSILYNIYTGFIGVGTNLIQGGIGSVIAYLITPRLKARI